jgi:hypothetical protein
LEDEYDANVFDFFHKVILENKFGNGSDLKDNGSDLKMDFFYRLNIRFGNRFLLKATDLETDLIAIVELPNPSTVASEDL